MVLTLGRNIMSQHIEWMSADAGRPGVLTPQAYPRFVQEHGVYEKSDEGKAAFALGVDDLMVIYGTPRELVALAELLLAAANRTMHGYLQPGCYVGPDLTPWRATHAEGDPCERAVTTHDCPHTHTYTPVSGMREFSFDCHECGHEMVEEHPVQEGGSTHIESRCPQCGTQLFEDFDNEEKP